MKIHSVLKNAIYETIHRSKKDINEISEETGISYNLLSRYCYPDDNTSFAKMPLLALLPILNSADNNAILDYFENKRGRVAFKIPRGCMPKMEESELLEDYQKVTIDAIRALREFLSNPDGFTYKAVDDALKTVMARSAGVKKYCDKTVTGQLELDL